MCAVTLGSPGNVGSWKLRLSLVVGPPTVVFSGSACGVWNVHLTWDKNTVSLGSEILKIRSEFREYGTVLGDASASPVGWGWSSGSGLGMCELSVCD